MDDPTEPTVDDLARAQQLIAEIAAAASEDPARAAELARAAFPDGIDHPVVLRSLAYGAQAGGDDEQALALLRRANRISPRDIEVLNELGYCLTRLGRPDAAIAAFDAALAIQPEMLSALCNKAAACLALADLAGARKAYERAALLHPGSVAPENGLASLAARQGDAEEARVHALRSLAIWPNQSIPVLALAQADLQDGEIEAARTKLQTVLADPRLPLDQRSFANTLLGDALDGLGRPADAFAAYVAANRDLETSHTAIPAESAAESASGLVERLTTYFEAAPAAPWRTRPGPDEEGAKAVRGHVFLIGFPRSGTTLLEQALASHPDVISIEETNALAEPSRQWLADADALDRLSAIGTVEAKRTRSLYWRRVRQLAPLGGGEKVLVDKLPLHTVRLPLIAKLFPDAKILFSRRDPRDVVLSCFRRRIRMNSTADEFLSLEGAARYYDQVMRLADIYLAKLPLDVRVVRHEDFVADFEAEATAALRFIGLDWEPSIQSFAAQSRRRATSPSAAQVARGLNAEGIGQWRRYKEQMAPALPTLQPWVDEFGYAGGQAKAPSPEPVEPVEPAGQPAQQAAREAATLADAQAAVGRGDWQSAFDIAESALAQGLTAPLFYKLRSVRREQQGHLDLAIADLETVLAATPDDFAALNALGLCLARAGRPAEAVEKLDAALKLEPGYAPSHYNRGWALENLGDLTAARASYEQAVALDPNHAKALGNLAALAVRTSDIEDAKSFALRALGLESRQPTASIAMAQVELAGGELDNAEQRLKGLLSDQFRAVTLHDRSVALGVLGDVLDRRDRPNEAFQAYVRANEGLRTLNAPRFAAPGIETAYGFATRLLDEFGGIGADDWPTEAVAPVPTSPAAGHIFVLGFPRSGTTLLGQVLAAHPDVVTLDEHETLVDASRAFLVGRGGLARLAESDSESLDSYREAYWRRVQSHGVAVAGKVFVDKLPMNTLGLPLISRLFPDARIVFVERDPRDVVLSCFRRQFVIGSSTWEMLTLDGTARFYDAVMRLAEAYRARLGLKLRAHRHEDLVADFEGQTKALCAFIGLEWSASMASFAEAAAQRAIATPSASQIIRGLSTEGVGQWRRFSAQLAPVFPRLAPWIERFAYSAE